MNNKFQTMQPVQHTTKSERRATNNGKRTTYLFSRATSDERRAMSLAPGGFSLLEVIGVLAIIGILMALIIPNVMSQIDDATRDGEAQSLRGMAQAIELYLRETHAFPSTLASLSPDYIPGGDNQLSQNPRGFPRYYVLHPTIATFDNAVGLAASDIPDARFLLISDVSVDAVPTITNAAEFDTWWDTDDSTSSDLFIERGHVGDLFRLIDLQAVTTGGSYTFDSVATNSGCGITLAHNRYHLVGTRVGLDEGLPYSVPEVHFAVHTDASYELNPCRPGGIRWKAGPGSAESCGGGVGGCGSVSGIWLTTSGDVGNPSGAPGLDEWHQEEIIQMADPNLAFEPGTTDGTFSSVVDFGIMGGSDNINAVDYVQNGVTVGTTTTFDLLPGDLLLSTGSSTQYTSNNTLSVASSDVFVFRPATPGDYSIGTFYMLLHNWGEGSIYGISVVEQDTVVGDVTLPAGTFLFSGWNGGKKNIQHFAPTDVGAGNGAGTTSVLIDGGDISIANSAYMQGVYLVESSTTLGGTTLSPGTILATLNINDSSMGSNLISTQQYDIFALDVISTTMGSGTTVANATVLMEGLDVGLDISAEDIDGLTLAE